MVGMVGGRKSILSSYNPSTVYAMTLNIKAASPKAKQVG